ncbi:MAG: hypothetical protein FMNOHCHN_03839 [Ignavibacteriaceae bacterium]|nr:hypothetical protein [Ignavibacteriaceae bacterium]
MKTIEAYLILSRSGAISVRKGRPYLNSDEVSFRLSVNLPDDFFNRVIPVIEVNVPKEAIYNPEATLALDLLSDEVAEKLELEATDVRDGLQELMRQKLDKQK